MIIWCYRCGAKWTLVYHIAYRALYDKFARCPYCNGYTDGHLLNQNGEVITSVNL